MSAVWMAGAAGLVGSLHCVAMCGPLAAAGCPDRRRTVGYFAGRLVAYALAGALCGAAGAEVVAAAGSSSVQRVAAIAVAVAAAWRGVALWRADRRDALVQISTRPPRPSRRPWWSHVVDAAPRAGLGLGLITGILPCGMLVAGWALAASTGDPLRGAAAMVVFWAATAPGLVVPVIARRALGRVSAVRVPRRVAAVAWCALAAFLLARPAVDAAMHASHSHASHPDSHPGDHAPACHPPEE